MSRGPDYSVRPYANNMMNDSSPVADADLKDVKRMANNVERKMWGVDIRYSISASMRLMDGIVANNKEISQQAEVKASNALQKSLLAASASSVAERKSEEANQKSDLAQTHVDTVLGATTIDPAVEQMKVGSDGRVYSSPDERVRSEHQGVSSQLGYINERVSKVELQPKLVRTGQSYNDLTLEKPKSNEPVTHDMTILSSPNMQTLTDFVSAGIDPEGYAVNQNGRKRTKDGGKTFEEITSNGMHTPFIWFDEQGNAYRSGGKDIYRSPASAGYVNYDFKKVAEVDTGFITGFSFETDGMGGVYFAEYTYQQKGNNFIYSHDYGETWTKKIIEYGQDHFHTIHFHKPSGNLYLVVGEGGSWRGILKSTDRGETFTQIESPWSNIQPISASTRGKYVVWGRDSTPSGYLILDTETDELTRIQTFNSLAKASGSHDYTGFYYSMVDMDGVIVTPSGSGGTENLPFPLMTLDNLGQASAIFNQHRQNQRYSQWMNGPDASGHYYLGLSNNKDTAVFKKLKKSKQKFYLTNDTQDVILRELSGEVDEVIGDVEFKRIESGSSSTGNFSVTGGEILNLVSYVKNMGAGNFRLHVFYQKADDTWTGEYIHIDKGYFSVGEMTKLELNYRVPSDVKGSLSFRWEIYGSGASGGYHLVSPISVQRNTSTSLRYVEEDAKDTFEIVEGVSENYLFKDIIYNNGYSDYYQLNKEMPLLKVNDIEVGLIKKEGPSYETYLYINQRGQRLSELSAVQYGGVMEDEMVLRRKSLGSINTDPQFYRPAPIRVGVTENKIYVYSSETGETFGFDLIYPVIGLLEIELLGSAYHSPHVYQNVQKDRVRDYLLND